MTEDTSLDLTGVGKLAKAIPAKAWIEVVHTACETFREAIAPFTATTSGVARLIEAKFDRLVDAEKLLAADVVRKASQKAQRTPRKKARTPQPKIVVAAIEASANETDVLLRDLWSNLLAQELVDGQMHPEFPRILSRLSTTDARVLAWVASQEKDKTALMKQTIKLILAKGAASIGLIDISAATNENTERLVSCGLIRDEGGTWVLTHTGRAFIRAVSDPSIDESSAV